MSLSLNSKGLIIILSSPSGAGKSSLAQALVKIDNNLRLSISATTRLPRLNELNEVNYYFKTQDEFNRLIKQNMFLEYAKIYNNYYGTFKQSVENMLAQRLDVLFDIDWQGARSIKQVISNVVTIFILPLNFNILEQRLKDREQDSIESIALRMKTAIKEILHVPEYDYVVINDDFDITMTKIHSIIIAERTKRIRLDKLNKFLKNIY